MALPTNFLETVQTYQKANLAHLLNSYAFINKANKKFKNFQNLEANLGDTVTFDLPPRYTTNSTLIATFQESEQRKEELTVDQAVNTAYAFNAQQIIFNVEDYMKEFGTSANEEIGTTIESNVALNCETAPYRFYGDGTTAINSFGQLAEAMAFYRTYGAPKGMALGYLDDLAVPGIVNSGLSQFVPKRNEEIANSWELGNFSKTEWLQSNLLPIHTAGTLGETAAVLTVTATTVDADGGISAITFSGAGADADAVKQYDSLQFSDGVTGYANVRYRTFIGHKPSGAPVQVQATADAASATDSVTITITPKLYLAAGRKQNITTDIVAGMQATILPSHRCGVIYAGDAFYLGMPKLPDEVPFPTANYMDPDSGCSIRMYYGSKFGLNERGFVHDAIWGSRLVPEYSMKIVFPL